MLTSCPYLESQQINWEKSILFNIREKFFVFYARCLIRTMYYAKLFHRPIVSNRINLLNESCKMLQRAFTLANRRYDCCTNIDM